VVTRSCNGQTDSIKTMYFPWKRGDMIIHAYQEVRGHTTDIVMWPVNRGCSLLLNTRPVAHQCWDYLISEISKKNRSFSHPNYCKPTFIHSYFISPLFCWLVIVDPWDYMQYLIHGKKYSGQWVSHEIFLHANKSWFTLCIFSN
jgi:hypothetical protein